MFKIILISCFLLNISSGIGQGDTIFIIVRGDFNKNDRFRLKTAFGIKNFGGNNPGFKEMSIYIDSTKMPFEFIDKLAIIQSKFFKPNKRLKYYFIYNPDYKYLHIYYIKTSKRKGVFHIYYLPFKESIYVMD